MNRQFTTENSAVEAADIVVVGAGLAGLGAAVTALDAGLDVILLESTDVGGGSTAMSGGWFAFSNTQHQQDAGIIDSDEMFYDDMWQVSGHRADPALLQAYLDNQGEAYASLISIVPEIGALKISSGQTVARSHQFDVHAFTAHLRQRLEQAGMPVRVRHRAQRLLVDERGTIVGVETDAPHGTTQFRARGGVVLTTGGFSRSSDLLERFAPDQLAGIAYGGTGNLGDGLVMAWAQGAGFRDMGYIAGTYGSHPETGVDEHELLTAFYMGAIIVNQHGERFIDESDSYKTLGAACLKQPGGMGYQIFDAKIRAKSEPGVPLSDIDHLEQKGRLLVADTLEELAALADIDPAALTTTVDEYNRVADGATKDEFARTHLCNGVGGLVRIDQAPYYAYPAQTLMTSTYAGLTVSPNAEVLRADGYVIDGLYAAGEIVGGFHGVAYMTGAALGKALIFGRVAALEVSERIKRTSHA